MKKYVRDILDDLQRAQAKSEPPVENLDAPPEPAAPNDLENQELSKDPAILVQQLDEQAQDSQIRQSLE